jgi:hypothetical protein
MVLGSGEASRQLLRTNSGSLAICAAIRRALATLGRLNQAAQPLRVDIEINYVRIVAAHMKAATVIAT